MKKTLKFLHSLGAAGMTGALIAHLMIICIANIVLAIWRPRFRRTQASATQAAAVRPK